jgi:hypothetical protein
MYVAPMWDGEYVAVEAMTLNWARVAVVRGRRPATVLEGPTCYVFPPLGLIVPGLRNLALDGAVMWVVCRLNLSCLAEFDG